MKKKMLSGAAVAIAVALLAVGLPVAAASAATVCCYRWADAVSTIRNQVLYGPTVAQIDWARVFVAGGGGLPVGSDIRIVTPSGTHQTTGGTWSWVTVNPAGIAYNSKGRCHWTSNPPISGTIPITCEMDYWN